MSDLYISPLTIMSWDSDTIPSAKDIHAARQRLLAELELSGGVAVLIRNRPYSKDDIIKAFDRLMTDDYMPYHLQVKHDTALLNFLENGAYSSKAHFGKHEIYGDETFLRWLAPHFATAFAAFLKVSIETQKPKGLARLLAERIKIADEYEDEAWAPLRRELLKATSFLELYNDEKFPLEEEQQEHIKQLGATLFLQIVRLKPEHLFYGETCEYARLLNNATTRIDSVLPLTSYCIYSNLLNLKLEYSLERTCSGNKNILSGYGKKVRHIKCDGIPGRWAIHGKKTETNIRFEDNMPWWGYLVTIFIIFGVARICGGTDEHRSPGRNNHHYTMPVLPDAKQKIIDSIATKILTGDISLDSAQRLYMKSLKKPIENRQTDSNE